MSGSRGEGDRETRHPPPDKSQVAIGFLRNIGTGPLPPPHILSNSREAIAPRGRLVEKRCHHPQRNVLAFHVRVPKLLAICGYSFKLNSA